MKYLLIILIAAGLFASSAQASITLPYIQQQTTQVINKRLKFLGIHRHVVSTKCQRDFSTEWFCIVKLSNYSNTLYYVVTLKGHILSWDLQK